MIKMDNIDIDGILNAVNTPEGGKNLGTILDTVREVNVVLKELQKTVDFLDRCGIKPLIVRAAGAKLGVDVDTPLQAEKGFKAATQTHAQIYNHLNQMSEVEVAKMFSPTQKEEENEDDEK